MSSSSNSPQTAPNSTVIAEIIANSIKTTNYRMRSNCKSHQISKSTVLSIKKAWLQTNPSHSQSFDINSIHQFIINRRQKQSNKTTLLTEEQEKQLVEVLESKAKAAVPVYCDNLPEFTQKFFSLASLPSEHWNRNFIKRYPTIKPKNSSKLTMSRAAALNPTIVSAFFDDLKKIYEEFHLTDTRIFNLDEKGFSGAGDLKNPRVLVTDNVKTSNLVRKIGFNEHVSLLCIVSANGYALPPLICFEGDSLKQSDFDKTWPEVGITTQSNGYFTKSTLLPVIKHFNKHWNNPNDPIRLTKSPTSPILLIMDGSTSHLDSDALQYATDNDIIIYRLPPNTTHRLQPLDRSCFAPLSYKYNNLCQKYKIKFNLPCIKRENVCPILHSAFDLSFTRANIVAGFASSKIWPWNPSKITADDYGSAVLNPPLNRLETNRLLPPLVLSSYQRIYFFLPLFLVYQDQLISL